MGIVFEARHVELDRRFAVKVLQSHLLKDPHAVARFYQEARAVASLEHENVVAVTDFGVSDAGVPFLVMEYLEGLTLAAMLKARRLSPTEACRVLAEACVGVGCAHARNILHRDLKPANLFVCELALGRTLTKVLDFGVAKVLSDLETTANALTHSGVVPGTPQYMSPEQARGERALDKRSDVYALGLILYECLSGRRVHGGEQYNEILYRILNHSPQPLTSRAPGLPRELADVVDRAMAFEPAQRYRDATELAQALAPFCSLGAPVLVPQRALDDSSDPASSAPDAELREIATLSAAASVAESRRKPLSDGAHGRGRRVLLSVTAAVGLTVIALGAWRWAATAGSLADVSSSSAAPQGASTHRPQTQTPVKVADESSAQALPPASVASAQRRLPPPPKASPRPEPAPAASHLPRFSAPQAASAEGVDPLPPPRLVRPNPYGAGRGDGS
jgi:serine/threonine-protein kinase